MRLAAVGLPPPGDLAQANLRGSGPLDLDPTRARLGPERRAGRPAGLRLDPGKDRCALGGGALAEPIDGRPPRTLADAVQPLGGEEGGEVGPRRAGEDPPLRRGEPLADAELDLPQRRAEGGEVALGDGGQEVQEDQAAEAVNGRVGQGGDLAESADLGGAVKTGRGGRDRDEDGPVGGPVEPGEQGGGRGLVPSAPTAVDDQAAKPEAVEADPRPKPSPRQGCQVGRRQVGQGPRTRSPPAPPPSRAVFPPPGRHAPVARR